ncbi:TPA: hypothetical protein ACJJT5_001734 [Neisseria meningitidis]
MPSEKHNHLIKSPACCKTDGLIGWCVFARKKRCKVVCCKILGIKCRFMPFFGSNMENIVKFEHEVLIVCWQVFGLRYNTCFHQNFPTGRYPVFEDGRIWVCLGAIPPKLEQ